MKRARIELAVMLACLFLVPSAAFAQDDMMSFTEEETGEDEAAPPAGEEGGADMTFGEEEASEEEEEGLFEEEGEEGAGEAGGGGVTDADIMSALGDEGAGAEAEGAAAPAEGEGPEEGDEEWDRHPIWAVQQVYALRSGRVDVQPSLGISMNDPFVQHLSINLGASYYITEVLSAGLSFNFYRWLDATTDLNYSVSRATHQTVPINEYFWGGQLNFSYVPIYGKFAMFKEWIVHWDVWVIGGGGFIFTRPIPVIDPEYREFDYSAKFSFNVGLGGRLYLTRFLAIYLELRDYIFPEELESLETYFDEEERADKKNWLDEDYKLTNNVMLHVGVSLFVPFTFEYELPK
ncbi:MAG: outer membrane beta-barrel domain-containing protein [Polyangia bacterium]